MTYLRIRQDLTRNLSDIRAVPQHPFLHILVRHAAAVQLLKVLLLLRPNGLGFAENTLGNLQRNG